MLVAFVTGSIAAHLNLALRSRVRDEAVNTILSFTTPFAAAVPAELLHGSGLVAAVVAGIVTSIRAPRALPPGHRMSDAQNWATVEIVLEGLIFLTMGLQLSTIVEQLSSETTSIGRGTLIAALALAVTLGVRAAYVGPLLWRLHRLAQQRREKLIPRIAAMQRDLDDGKVPRVGGPRVFQPKQSERMLERFASHIRRRLADIDYLAQRPLGRAETLVVIWAGMRGAVTVAAVQLLPESTPHRPLLVFIASAVATLSLLLQGGTIGLLVKTLFPAVDAVTASRAQDGERARIRALLDSVDERVVRGEDVCEKDHRMMLLRRQRHALLDARDDGIFDAEVLEVALLHVDVDELVLELRGESLAY